MSAHYKERDLMQKGKLGIQADEPWVIRVSYPCVTV